MNLINQNDTDTSRKSFIENLSAILQFKKKRLKNGNKSPHEHQMDKKYRPLRQKCSITVLLTGEHCENYPTAR